MPWCEECAKYFAPSSMNPDGTCPKCGRPIEEPKVQAVKRSRGSAEGEAADEAEEEVKAPWHFKLLMVMLVLYLTYRFVELFR